MSECSIKLFSTRAEQYLEPTEVDAALGAGRAVLAAIPFVAGRSLRSYRSFSPRPLRVGGHMAEGAC